MGKHSDVFFTQHGMPYQAYQLDHAGMLFAWSSRVRSVTMPSTTPYSGTAGPYGMYSGTATTHGEATLEVVCALQIRTDANRIITGITIMRDTVGWWETSRCNELFN